MTISPPSSGWPSEAKALDRAVVRYHRFRGRGQRRDLRQVCGSRPGPCPSWCSRDHSREQLGPGVGSGRARIGHWCPDIGGAVPAGEDFVRVSLAWNERFEDGAWQPSQARDITVYLGYGTVAIAFEATEGNLAGLNAIARLISPEAGDVALQAGRLAEATLGPGPATAR